MKVVFISIGGMSDLRDSGLYQDLLKYFRDMGHDTYIVSQRERRSKLKTELVIDQGINVLRVKTGNITKVNVIEKGISTLTIGSLYKKAINTYFKHIKFDLIIYATPPITIANTVGNLKKRDRAMTYLMLKDIFPQNALDLDMLKHKGFKGLITKYFSNIEKKLYAISDYIGCMSEANIRFLKNKNPEIPNYKIELCPNTINPIVKNQIAKSDIRKKYNIPEDKIVFIYGGNFGKPQNVDYIIEILEATKDHKDIFFVMSGSGTDFYKIKELNHSNKFDNLMVFESLSRNDYYNLVDACDIGMIFLDYRFTIPNIPSRLLDYLNHELPVIAATDINTDLGKIIREGQFGWWCESRLVEDFTSLLSEVVMNKSQLNAIGKKGKKYLEEHFHTRVAYNTIIEKYSEREDVGGKIENS